MKKTIAILLALTLLLSVGIFAACNKQEEPSAGAPVVDTSGWTEYKLNDYASVKYDPATFTESNGVFTTESFEMFNFEFCATQGDYEESFLSLNEGDAMQTKAIGDYTFDVLTLSEEGVTMTVYGTVLDGAPDYALYATAIGANAEAFEAILATLTIAA